MRLNTYQESMCSFFLGGSVSLIFKFGGGIEELIEKIWLIFIHGAVYVQHDDYFLLVSIVINRFR